MQKTTLNAFLNEHKRPQDKSLPCTHTSMGPIKGSYHIPDADLDEFYNLYTDACHKKYDLGIVERHKSVSPVLIDIDLKQVDDTPFLKYKHICQFIYIVLQTLQRYVVLPEECLCVIQQKPVRQSDGIFKDGVHIIIQNVVTTPDIQFKVRELIIKKKPNFFHEIHSYQNDIDDIYDQSVIKDNGWLMPGSKKDSEKIGWVIKHIVSYCTEKGTFKRIEKEDRFQKCDWIRFLSIRNKDDCECPYTERGMALKTKLAKQHKTQRTKKLHKKDCKKRPTVDQAESGSKTQQHTLKDDSDEENAHKLWEMNNEINEYLVIKDRLDKYFETFHIILHDLFDETYADKYTSWIEIGYCLHSLGNAYLPLWHSFSERSPKYKKDECDATWNDMRISGNVKTIASLLQYLK